MKEISDGDKLLAIVWRDADWTPGLNFPTPADMFVLAGCWQYPAGKVLGAHRHIYNERIVTQTQESVYVKRGRLKVNVFDEDSVLVESVILESGDFAVLGDCGHGYEILEDDTQILEIKNGPFVGVEADKEAIEL